MLSFGQPNYSSLTTNHIVVYLSHDDDDDDNVATSPLPPPYTVKAACFNFGTRDMCWP